MLLAIATVEVAIAVAPALTKRVVLLHRRLAGISDYFQQKFFVNIEIVVPVVPFQPVEAVVVAFVVASSVGDSLLLKFASVVVAVPCLRFVGTS